MAGAVRRVEDLVIEDREVESQTKADGVGRGQLGLSNIGSALDADGSVGAWRWGGRRGILVACDAAPVSLTL